MVSTKQSKVLILVVLAFCIIVGIGAWKMSAGANDETPSGPKGDIYYTGFMKSKPEREKDHLPGTPPVVASPVNHSSGM